jgi:hypothetical protein
MNLDDTEAHIFLLVKASDWWGNEQVNELNWVIATIILTSSIATAATWRYNCPSNQQLRPDKSYKPSGCLKRMAYTLQSQKYQIDD